MWLDSQDAKIETRLTLGQLDILLQNHRKQRNFFTYTSFYRYVIGYLSVQFMRIAIAFQRMWQPANSPGKTLSRVEASNVHILIH